MPKVTPFKIEDGYRYVLQKILEEKIKEKSKKINIYGVEITSYSTYSNTSFKQLTQEEYEELIKNEYVLKLLEKHHEQQKKEKIKKYEEIRTKGDFVLFDYKPFVNLIKVIDEFSYCGATSEIENMIKTQTKGTSYLKAVYRARLQEFNKIKC